MTTNNETSTRQHSNAHETTIISGELLQYDPQGNIVDDSLGTTYQWDADGMLASVTQSTEEGHSEAVFSYQYDAFNRRVASTIDGGVIRVRVQATTTVPHLKMGGQTIAEYELGAPATLPIRNYIFSERVDDVLAMTEGQERTYFHHNAQQS